MHGISGPFVGGVFLVLFGISWVIRSFGIKIPGWKFALGGTLIAIGLHFIF